MGKGGSGHSVCVHAYWVNQSTPNLQEYKNCKLSTECVVAEQIVYCMKAVWNRRWVALGLPASEVKIGHCQLWENSFFLNTWRMKAVAPNCRPVKLSCPGRPAVNAAQAPNLLEDCPSQQPHCSTASWDEVMFLQYPQLLHQKIIGSILNPELS